MKNSSLLQRVTLFEAFLALFVTVCPSAQADEMKYAPINPSFGGNPFNSAHLIGTATAQRQFSPKTNRTSPTDEFADSIQRSLLSRVAREISDQILGENAKESGSFEVGDTFLDFRREGGQVIINVSDPKTGDKTTIQLDAPVY